MAVLAAGPDSALAGLAAAPGGGRRLAPLRVGRGEGGKKGVELLGRMGGQAPEGAGPAAQTFVGDHIPLIRSPAAGSLYHATTLLISRGTASSMST
jgi:hypothetical protein